MPDQVDILVEKLKISERGLVRASIVEDLGNLGDPRVIKPIVDALNDSETMVRWNAIKALAKFGEDVAPILIKKLDSNDRFMRRNIVQVLGEIGSDQTTDALIRMLIFDESDKTVLIEVIKALQKLHPKRAVEPLITVLKIDDWEMKWRAIHTLGRIGDPKAIEPLLEILNDQDQDLRWASSMAIENIKNISMKRADPNASESQPDEVQELRASAEPSHHASDLGLTTSAPNGRICIHVTGEINSGNAKVFKGFIDGVISASNDPIEIDLKKCDFLDSYALSIMNNIRKRLSFKKRQLILSGMAPNVRMVFKATKLDTIFEIRD